MKHLYLKGKPTQGVIIMMLMIPWCMLMMIRMIGNMQERILQVMVGITFSHIIIVGGSYLLYLKNPICGSNGLCLELKILNFTLGTRQFSQTP